MLPITIFLMTKLFREREREKNKRSYKEPKARTYVKQIYLEKERMFNEAQIIANPRNERVQDSIDRVQEFQYEFNSNLNFRFKFSW